MSVIGKDAEILVKASDEAKITSAHGIGWEESSSSNMRVIKIPTLSSEIDRNYLFEVEVNLPEDCSNVQIVTAELIFQSD